MMKRKQPLVAGWKWDVIHAPPGWVGLHAAGQPRPKPQPGVLGVVLPWRSTRLRGLG